MRYSTILQTSPFRSSNWDSIASKKCTRKGAKSDWAIHHPTTDSWTFQSCQWLVAGDAVAVANAVASACYLLPVTCWSSKRWWLITWLLHLPSFCCQAIWQSGRFACRVKTVGKWIWFMQRHSIATALGAGLCLLITGTQSQAINLVHVGGLSLLSAVYRLLSGVVRILDRIPRYYLLLFPLGREERASGLITGISCRSGPPCADFSIRFHMPQAVVSSQHRFLFLLTPKTFSIFWQKAEKV